MRDYGEAVIRTRLEHARPSQNARAPSRVLSSRRAFYRASDQRVTLRGVVEVCSRRRHQRIVREELQAAVDPVLK